MHLLGRRLYNLSPHPLHAHTRHFFLSLYKQIDIHSLSNFHFIRFNFNFNRDRPPTAAVVFSLALFLKKIRSEVRGSAIGLVGFIFSCEDVRMRTLNFTDLNEIKISKD